MTGNLKVKVFKKSKSAPYPEHIMIEKKATNEIAHLFFEDGTLTRLTHVIQTPQIKISYVDDKETVYQDIIFNCCDKNPSSKRRYLEGPKYQDFFIFFEPPSWEFHSICFKSHPKHIADLFIETDLNNRCIPYNYLKNYGTAEIEEVYNAGCTRNSSHAHVVRKSIER